MSVGGEFGRRAADDELCAAVAKAVADGDADALRRLGFDGWGDYVQRLSELMNESVRDGLEQSDDFGALMSQVASPARYAHHLVTESGTAVQTAKDEPLGIHLKPLEPEFDDDALKGTVGTAASKGDPKQVVETLADGLAYAVKKAGNEFVEKNAEQRSRAGFEVTVKRTGSSKCCPWCAARIGSWALKNAPDDIFGCHANCSCVVEYTNSTGVTTQRRGTGRFVEVEYQPPHVMTHEEAREKGGFDEPKRLTGGGNGGIIGSGGNGGGSNNNDLPADFDDPRELLKKKIQSGELPLTINPEKQARHMLENGERFKSDGRSFLTISIEEAQRIVDKFSTTGDITYIPKSKRFSEFIDTGVILGVDGRSGKPTSQAFIKYSKTGTHLVPTIKGR